MKREVIEADLYEIEAILADEDLKDEDRAALFGPQQVHRRVSETWPASQTFYRVGTRPVEAASNRRH